MVCLYYILYSICTILKYGWVTRPLKLHNIAFYSLYMSLYINIERYICFRVFQSNSISEYELLMIRDIYARLTQSMRGSYTLGNFYWSTWEEFFFLCLCFIYFLRLCNYIVPSSKTYISGSFLYTSNDMFLCYRIVFKRKKKLNECKFFTSVVD